MILIALGANKAGPWGPPAATLAAAVPRLEQCGVIVTARSPLYRTAPLGPSAQPEFVNAVIAVATRRPARALMALLHELEREAGRRRSRPWSARELDLDLLAYDGCVTGWPDGTRPESGLEPSRRAGLVLPHPGIDRRPFVAVPLAAVAPLWHHPVTGETAAAMAARLGRSPGGRVLAIMPDPGWDAARRNSGQAVAGLAPSSVKP